MSTQLFGVSQSTVLSAQLNHKLVKHVINYDIDI